MEQILSTKLFIPVTRPECVQRKRLSDRLSQGLHRKLTLISAPAGFGKTTLVTEWLHDLKGDAHNGKQVRNRIAWLSLDEGDNDLVRFLTYFIAALNQLEGLGTVLGKEMLGSIQSPQPPIIETAVASLINEIAAVQDRIIFVLDDYHVIDASPIHQALHFLLENSPPGLHLVLTTREDPYLPLSRLRARDQMTELRAGDLRFSSTEAAEFLNQVMGLNLSAEDIVALEARTEGWIAGLQLAAVSLQGHTDKSRLIQSFTGSHRLVLDYLVEEVLNQQSPEIQSFLLCTSILERMCSSLCDAVTGRDKSQVILETLDHANLFIVPLDSERRWYRYHHLFGDLLRQRLTQEYRQQIPQLVGRASDWYEQRNLMPEAIRYAFAAEDYERAAALIETQADIMWPRGEHVQLQDWLMRLPEKRLAANPRLCIYHAWYLYASGQHDASKHFLQILERALDAKSDRTSELESSETLSIADEERAKLRGRVYAIYAFMETHQGDVSGIIQYARQALATLPEQDATWRSITAIVLGDAYGFAGDMQAAYATRLEARQICRAAGLTYYCMLASMKLAITLRELGQLYQTVEICQQEIDTAGDKGLAGTSLTGLFLLIEGEVLAELNQLQEASLLATKGDALLERAVDLVFYGWGYMCLIRILFSRGEWAAAEDVVRRMESIDRSFDVPAWVMNQLAAWRARIWLMRGNLDAAIAWSRTRGLETDRENKPVHIIDYPLLGEYLVLARIYIAEGRYREAVTLLKHLHQAAEAGHRLSRMIEILALKALAIHASGETEEALAVLAHAITLAQPERFIRVFVDEGPPMATVLYEALSHDIAPGYVRRLLAAFPLSESERPGSPDAQPDEFVLVESLSERELEVLQLIGEGLTNSEIASRLFLSLNTIKVHTRNIYGKLGVKNRTQAVARGRALGIVHAS